MAHTPGPWKIEYPLEDEMDEQPQITAREGKTLVATILGPLSDEDGLARGAYDARLMQAAPDLLVACQRAKTFLDELLANVLTDLRALHGQNVLNTIQDAIARATPED